MSIECVGLDAESFLFYIFYMKDLVCISF